MAKKLTDNQRRLLFAIGILTHNKQGKVVLDKQAIAAKKSKPGETISGSQFMKGDVIVHTRGGSLEQGQRA